MTKFVKISGSFVNVEEIKKIGVYSIEDPLIGKAIELHLRYKDGKKVNFYFYNVEREVVENAVTKMLKEIAVSTFAELKVYDC